MSCDKAIMEEEQQTRSADLEELPVRALLLEELTDADAAAIGILLARTWQNPEKDAAFRATQLLNLGKASAEASVDVGAYAFVVRDGERVIANAVMEPRLVHALAEDGSIAEEFLVLGLGKVCSDPDYRGRQLGATVTRAAFGMVDGGQAPFSLFQTSHDVRPFYERLGAIEINNAVINSKADDPTAPAFPHEVIMRYPKGPGWPTGTIDLLGPGY